MWDYSQMAKPAKGGGPPALGGLQALAGLGGAPAPFGPSPGSAGRPPHGAVPHLGPPHMGEAQLSGLPLKY